MISKTSESTKSYVIALNLSRNVRRHHNMKLERCRLHWEVATLVSQICWKSFARPNRRRRRRRASREDRSRCRRRFERCCPWWGTFGQKIYKYNKFVYGVKRQTDGQWSSLTFFVSPCTHTSFKRAYYDVLIVSICYVLSVMENHLDTERTTLRTFWFHS